MTGVLQAINSWDGTSDSTYNWLLFIPLFVIVGIVSHFDAKDGGNHHLP